MFLQPALAQVTTTRFSILTTNIHGPSSLSWLPSSARSPCEQGCMVYGWIGFLHIFRMGVRHSKSGGKPWGSRYACPKITRPMLGVLWARVCFTCSFCLLAGPLLVLTLRCSTCVWVLQASRVVVTYFPPKSEHLGLQCSHGTRTGSVYRHIVKLVKV